MSDREKIEALLDDAFQNYLDGSPKAAVQNCLEALKIAEIIRDPHLCARAQIGVSRAYRWLHQPQQAMDHIHKALALAPDFNDPALNAFAMFVHGRILIQIGLPDDAYSELASVIEWAIKNEDFELQARALDWQAVLFVLAANFPKAADLLQQAQALQDRHDFRSLRATLPLHQGFYQSRIGEHMFEEGDLQAHKDHFQVGLIHTQQSIDAAIADGDQYALFIAYCNAAECAAVQGEFDLAEDFLKRAEQLPSGLMEVGAVHFLYTRSEVANRRGDSEDAIKHGLDALEATKINPAADNAMNAQRRLADAYEAAGQFENAYNAYKIFHAQYRKSLARRAYWQDRLAAYKANVNEMRNQLEQANVHAELMAEAAFKDALTGLANRRAFDQTLLQYEKNTSLVYAIAILDLDHFKDVNDTFSHIVGDDVLKFVADILDEHTRSGDLVARIGGEEFAIIMPHTTQESAIIVCERIRRQINGWQWEKVRDGLEVSTSGGIAMSHEGDLSRDVYAIADARLYHAKTNGRNQVEAYALPAGLNGTSWAVH